MFGKSKDDNGQLTIEGQQPQASATAKPVEPVLADQISTIGRNMTVAGKIVDEGTVHVFGQIEGELRALTVLVGEGAKVEGDLVAEELTIGGMVKGTIHANRVKLNSTAVVEGDIFHRSLSIEENARFEGSSRRKDNAGDVSRTLLQHPVAQAEVQTEAAVIEGDRKSNGTSGHDESFSVGVS